MKDYIQISSGISGYSMRIQLQKPKFRCIYCQVVNDVLNIFFGQMGGNRAAEAGEVESNRNFRFFFASQIPFWGILIEGTLYFGNRHFYSNVPQPLLHAAGENAKEKVHQCRR